MPPVLLLVDDAPEIVLIAQRLGRRAGQEVIGCPDVPTARQALARRRPDLLAVDLHLPGPSGLELLQEARADRGLTTAVLGHWERPGDLAAGLEAGANFVLPKELLTQPEAWQGRVAEALAGAHGRADLLSLDWVPTEPPPPEQCVDPLNRLLGTLAVRRPGAEVLAVLLRRALRRAGVRAKDWLRPDGLGLDPSAVARSPRPGAVLAAAAALAEELWCVLGSADSALSRAALAGLHPLLAGRIAR